MERIEKHQEEGVVYFLDDDNIVSLNVFPELRAIKEGSFLLFFPPSLFFSFFS